MTHGTQLDPDIIFLLLSYLNPPDLAKFSAVCKAYHAPALRCLLSSDSIVLAHRDFMAFGVCVLADAPTRGPLIQRLKIHEGTKESEGISHTKDILSASALAAVFEYCSNLKKLEIKNLGALLVAEPQIGISIAGLPALTDLFLEGMAEPTKLKVLLRSLQSQLTRLKIQDDDWGVLTDLVRFPVPNPAASPSMANITELSMKCVQFPPRNWQHAPWTSVQKLDIDNCTFHLGRISAFLPNLRELRTGPSVEWTRSSPRWHDLDLLELHWYFSCTWTGCLTHQVRLVSSVGFPEELDDLEELLELFRGAQPVMLYIEPLSAQVGWGFWNGLHAAGSRLRYFEVEIEPFGVSNYVGLMVCFDVSYYPKHVSHSCDIRPALSNSSRNFHWSISKFGYLSLGDTCLPNGGPYSHRTSYRPLLVESPHFVTSLYHLVHSPQHFTTPEIAGGSCVR